MVDLANKVLILLLSFSFSFFFFYFLIFFFFYQKNGRNPLSIAAERGFKEVVKILIEYGSNIDLQDKVFFSLFLFFTFSFFYFFFIKRMEELLFLLLLREVLKKL